MSQPDDGHLAPYAGRWVAHDGRQVLAQGGSPQQARQAILALRPKERFSIMYVADQQSFELPGWLASAIQAIDAQIPVYLVGGAVRDGLLGLPINDVDLVVPSNAQRIARQMANQIGGAYFPLHGEFDAGRVIWDVADAGRKVIDLTGFRGPDLDADLTGRDFTINAMAVDARSPGVRYDPLGGAEDLRNHILRACSPDAMLNDPLRILRGIRFAAKHTMRIQPQTRDQMRAAVANLSQVSPERLRDELIKILGGKNPAASVRALDLLGVLEVVLPELSAMKGVSQSPPHIHPVWQHTIEVVRSLDLLLNALDLAYDPDTSANQFALGMAVLNLGRYREQISAHVQGVVSGDHTVRGMLFLAALFHDSGKPATRTIEPSGRIRFFGHEKISAELLQNRASTLRFSNLESTRLVRIARHHMRPVFMSNSNEPLTSRAIYRFFRAAGVAGVDVCLLSLADLLGTYGYTIPHQTWSKHTQVIRSLLEAWWEKRDQIISPQTLVTGNELIQWFGLSAGSQIGELLEQVREAQVSGEVVDVEDARAFIQTKLNG